MIWILNFWLESIFWSYFTAIIVSIDINVSNWIILRKLVIVNTIRTYSFFGVNSKITKIILKAWRFLYWMFWFVLWLWNRLSLFLYLFRHPNYNFFLLRNDIRFLQEIYFVFSRTVWFELISDHLAWSHWLGIVGGEAEFLFALFYWFSAFD